MQALDMRSNVTTRVALMIQLEQQQHGEFVVGGGVGGWLTPTTYIQLAGAESIELKNCIFLQFFKNCLKVY